MQFLEAIVRTGWLPYSPIVVSLALASVQTQPRIELAGFLAVLHSLDAGCYKPLRRFCLDAGLRRVNLSLGRLAESR